MESMKELEGRRALVTGARRGVGFAIAAELAAAGATVVATAREASDLKQVQDHIQSTGGTCEIVAGDLGSRQSIRRLAGEAGPVDILINNAALTTAKYQSLLVEDDDYWDENFALNVTAPVTLMQSLIPHMVETGRGVVINISTILAQKPSPLQSVYAASKAAMETASKSIALEFAPKGVRVLVVALGMTRTEGLAQAVGGPDNIDHMAQAFVPIGQVNEPNNVAKLCRFLASDAAATITGTSVTVDGGTTSGMFGFSSD